MEAPSTQAKAEAMTPGANGKESGRIAGIKPGL